MPASKPHLVKALIAAGIALLFAPAIWRLIDVGRTNEYAGHAMFVPLFAILVAWTDRSRLRTAAGPGHPGGVAVVVAGLAMLASGYAWHSDVAQGLAVSITAAGLVLWLFGAACLRAAAFPVGFLVLITPLPNVAVAAVTLELQSFAAGFAAAALRAIGIPVYRSGVYLELATMTLTVAEVCNGLRFLLALLVMTAAFAQIMLPTRRRKVALVAAAIPIAILANAVRVAAIGIGVHYIGPDAASGTVHNWIGKGVWVITLAPLIVLGTLLARGPRDRVGLILSPLPASSKTDIA